MIVRARLALALAFAVAGTAGRADAPAHRPLPPPAPAPAQAEAPAQPPAGAKRVEVHVTFAPWQYTGTFRVASVTGELIDQGTARDASGFASQNIIERVLEGTRGTLVLRVQRSTQVPRFPALFGRWEIVRGTGAYVHAAGGGTFTSCASGQAGKGSPFELQTLVGYARLR